MIDIDSQSGFCFGVNRSVDMAEKLLRENAPVRTIRIAIEEA